MPFLIAALLCGIQVGVGQTLRSKSSSEDDGKPVSVSDRQTLQLLTNRVQADPNSPDAHIKLSRELIQVGAGAMARREAAIAVELNPADKWALLNQGYILSFDLFGNWATRGYDRPGALAAYEKALKIDPADAGTHNLLGLTYARDENGDLFFGPDLDKAENMFRWLVMDAVANAPERLDQDRDLLARVLMYSHQYQQLKDVAEELLPANPMRSKYLIVAATGMTDAAAGVEKAGALGLSEPERSHSLLLAGSTLEEMGLLRQAAEIDEAATIVPDKDKLVYARKIQVLRVATPVPPDVPPVTSPESLVYAFRYRSLVGVSNSSVFADLLSAHSAGSRKGLERRLARLNFESGSLYVKSASGNSLPHNLLQIYLGGAQFQSKGSDETGYTVDVRAPSLLPSHYFVVREDGSYRIAALERDDYAAAYYILYALDHHHEALAAAMLNWKRSLLSSRATDDPLGNPAFLQLWTLNEEGHSHSVAAMRTAAISLLRPSPEARPLYDSLRSQQRAAKGATRTALDLVLASGYLGAQEPASALPYWRELSTQYPDSLTALELARILYTEQKNIQPFRDLLHARLNLQPNRSELLRVKVLLLATEHNYDGALSTMQQVLNSDRPTAADYNRYAWLALFDKQVRQDNLDAAQQAVTLTQSKQFAPLHTLACLFAAQGKVTEAREALKEAMAADGLDEPNSAVWFTLGLLYEDYGLRDAALDAYEHVKVDEWGDRTLDLDPLSTYTLAQQRIHELKDGV